MSQNGSQPRSEFRVRWQREGRSPVTRIFQTEAAARRKIDGVLALEEVKGDSAQWEDMPDLVGSPELQVREVGEWQRVEVQEAAPSERALKGVIAWAGIDEHPEGIF